MSNEFESMPSSIEELVTRDLWQSWSFSDLVENITEKVTPKESGIKEYIGLTHLDNGSLHVRRFGETEAIEGDKLKAYAGDIIFAKRNAYLKRVARIDNDVVVSAHALVLRAKPENVVPEFLPYFLLSECFWSTAIEISVGSLSPTINWKALSKQEFSLPPKDVQKKLARIFLALDEQINSIISVKDKNKQLVSCLVSEFFKNNSNKKVALENISEVKYGMTLNAKRKELPLKYPYLRVANVGRAKFSFDEIKEIGCTGDEARKYQLESGDVLVVEGHADIREIGRSALWLSNDEKMLHQNHLIRIRCDESKILPGVLNSYINSSYGKLYFQRHSKSTSGLNTINSSVVKKFQVPSIKLEKQNAYLKKKNHLLSQFEQIKSHLDNSNKLFHSLINKVF
jgi:type I restriction enzyme S subunit